MVSSHSGIALKTLKIYFEYIFEKKEITAELFEEDEDNNIWLRKRKVKETQQIYLRLQLKLYEDYTKPNNSENLKYTLVDVADIFRDKIKLHPVAIFSPLADVHVALVNELVRQFKPELVFVLYGFTTTFQPNEKKPNEYELVKKEKKRNFFTWLLVEKLEINIKQNTKEINVIKFESSLQWKWKDTDKAIGDAYKSLRQLKQCRYCGKNTLTITNKAYSSIPSGTPFCSNSCLVDQIALLDE